MAMKIVKWIWISLSMSVLLITLFNYDGSPNSDIGIFFTLAMEAITFPSGLLYAGVFSFCVYTFSLTIPTSFIVFIISWACFVTLGYFQWFIAIPWIIRKIKGGGSDQGK